MLLRSRLPHSALREGASVLIAASKPTFQSYTQRRNIAAYGYEQAKCLVLSNHGEPKDVIRLHGHSISPPHKDLVTLRMLAAPINPADINQIQGVYPTKPTFTTSLSTPDPVAVAGNEGVAEVLAKGGNVTGLEKGDWVIFRNQGFGTWRTHAQTTPDNLIPIKNRDGLTPTQVGTISVNPCTAYRMLKDFVQLREGDWIIQNGANSGVGRAVIQFAKLWGYKTLNIVRKRSDEASTQSMIDDLKSLGADEVLFDEDVDRKDSRDRIKSLTSNGKGSIRLGLNCVGGALVNSMAKHLSPGSPIVTYGAMSRQPVNLPMGLLIFKDIQFKGFWVSRWSNQNPQEKESCVNEILDLIRQGKFQDVPLQEVQWNHDTKQELLVDAVQGTLDGFRSGKGIFMFGQT